MKTNDAKYIEDIQYFGNGYGIYFTKIQIYMTVQNRI
jgi:hypothetical protein